MSIVTISFSSNQECDLFTKWVDENGIFEYEAFRRELDEDFEDFQISHTTYKKDDSGDSDNDIEVV